MASTSRSKEASVGVVRNLTEVFLLLRSNAQQNKFIYTNSDMPSTNRSRHIAEEKMGLISMEEGGTSSDEVAQQPLWIHTSDEVEYEFGRIRSRLEELAAIQQKHISRPNFGDDAFEAEEKKMEGMTEQITQMMSHSQRLINMMSAQITRRENASEKKLRENAVSNLVFTLSQLTSDFRSRQYAYLGNIKNRSKNVDDFLVTTGQTDEMQWGELVDVTPSQEYTMDQITQMMNNEQIVREREKEVLAVNSSIRELNTLFKDVSSMVVDQGTILDRIDYNVEMASVRVSKAVESIASAEESQRNGKKMKCIFYLIIAIIVVLILIIFKRII